MKLIIKQFNRKTAFTIVELLTVMTIIVILIGLLVPSLNMVKRYAKGVRQKAQFHSIGSALELFSSEWDGYPPSDALDEDNANYCGAMKLCEAMVGQDLMGFHPNSRFRADCTDGTNKLYANNPPGSALWPDSETNLKARKTYLQLEKVDAYRLLQLHDVNTTDFDEDLFVLCDVYGRVKDQATGKRIGMPILYYKANTLNTKHDPNNLPTTGNDQGQIYNYLDNDKLVNLDGSKFYEMTKDNRIDITTGRPYRPDSYILISAGFDGTYGTDDDITNF